MSIRIFAMFGSDWSNCCCLNWIGLNSQWTTSGWGPLPVVDSGSQTYHLEVNWVISVGDWSILDLAPSGGEHLYDPSKLIGHDHFVIWSDVIGHSPKRIEQIRFYSSWMPHRHRVLLDGLSPKINDQSLLGTPMTHLGSFYFQFIFIRIWSWIGICNGTGIWFMWKKGSNSRIRMIFTVGSQQPVV